MDQDKQEQRKFLEEQLEWTKNQAQILDEMNEKLLEMKRIAQSVLEDNLSDVEKESVNDQFNRLKKEVAALEQQLHSVIH
ncbi:hypothetical protein ACJ2A9_13750 [Anaerobacillus sp. MEB173]|uniref:hypothetical protein n=1 Tax=Anaerobacillus sp. MEB173 TaxID=3383345 RepID=UPI003F93DF23